MPQLWRVCFRAAFISYNFLFIRVCKREHREHKSRAEAWIVPSTFTMLAERQAFQRERASARASGTLERVPEEAAAHSLAAELGDGKHKGRDTNAGRRTDGKGMRRKRRKRTEAVQRKRERKSKKKRELVIAYYFWARKGTRGGSRFIISSRHYYGVVSPKLFPLSRRYPRVFPKCSECWRERERRRNSHTQRERMQLELNASEEDRLLCEMDIEMFSPSFFYICTACGFDWPSD